MQEKIRKAIDYESSRQAAISEAAGAIPLLRNRLREDEDVQAGFMLVFDVQLFEPHATPWGRGLRLHGSGRIREAGHLPDQGALDMLRQVAAASAETP